MPAHAPIPTYKLYGESLDWPTSELVHCETIAARSSLHDWAIRPHRHADLFQLLYCREGTVQVILDGTERNLSGPCLVTVPAMCVHGFRFGPECEGWVVTLPEFALRRFASPDKGLLEHVQAPRVLAWEAGARSHTPDALFTRFAQEFVTTRPGRLLALEALLGLILVQLAREAGSEEEARGDTGHRETARLHRFQKLVERHYRQWQPVSFYADALGVSAAQLNNTCRSTADRTALQIIHDRVLIEAKRNLVYTAMTVSEIAYALGFSDPAYFTRFFKKRTGKPPSQFRTTRTGPATADGPTLSPFDNPQRRPPVDNLITYTRTVRYSDTDVQGHVFNANYFVYFDDAITDYMTAVAAPSGGGDHGYEIVLGRAECDFRASAKLGETLVTGVRVEKVGTTSITFTLEITEKQSGRLIARGKEIYVVVDPDNLRPMPVPDGLRDAIARQEGDEFDQG